MTVLSLAPILYVEDEEDDVMLLRIAFKHAQIERPLTIAADGREALNYLLGIGRFANRAQYPFPCLVLLDLNLPQLGGFEVLQRIRQEAQLAALPVVIFSSSEKGSDRARARELGATDYIPKPSRMELLTEFAAMLKSRWLSNAA
jgi:CheY-like chemotaxis protein